MGSVGGESYRKLVIGKMRCGPALPGSAVASHASNRRGGFGRPASWSFASLGGRCGGKINRHQCRSTRPSRKVCHTAGIRGGRRFVLLTRRAKTARFTPLGSKIVGKNS